MPAHPLPVLLQDKSCTRGSDQEPPWQGCAQGHFWEMPDLLFANQDKIKLPDLLHYAQQLTLDVPRFQKALESGHISARRGAECYNF